MRLSTILKVAEEKSGIIEELGLEKWKYLVIKLQCTGKVIRIIRIA
jgi:hypothetical protein